MTRGLTPRQRDILEFIVRCVRDDGYPPTIAEIGDRFGISSTNGVNDHLVALERKGFIERSSKARSIHVTELAAIDLFEDEAGMLPLLGRVAAGQPLMAVENIEGRVPVEAQMAKRNAFCLRVAGDSMIEDGILDGDIVVVDQEKTPHKNDIVVALVDGEATVKHFHPAGNIVELRPANASMSPMRFPAHDVAVQGVVVALQRKL
jgi:repressor LexA